MRAVFVPTERLFYSQVQSFLATKLLSLPNTFEWFAHWMTRATDVYASWPKERPDTPHGKWVKERARDALHGEAYRWRDTWKWRFKKKQGGEGTLDLTMASSGQRATWPIVLLAETLFSMRKRGLIDDDFTIYVEEPEIHLHPEAQVAMVEILAHLVKRGFRVLLTTHSLTVLYALNNLVLAGGLTRGKNEKQLPHENSRLAPNTLAAYALGSGKPKDMVDKETGFISEVELGKVTEQLDQTMNRITELLHESKNDA